MECILVCVECVQVCGECVERASVCEYWWGVGGVCGAVCVCEGWCVCVCVCVCVLVCMHVDVARVWCLCVRFVMVGYPEWDAEDCICDEMSVWGYVVCMYVLRCV